MIERLRKRCPHLVNIRDLIGAPFRIHGRSKKEGFDCYGLLIEVMKRNGITLPDLFYEDICAVSDKNFKHIFSFEKIEKPELLCIILFKLSKGTHVGLYIDDGEFIHATEDYGVVLDKLYRWGKLVTGYYKVNA